MFFFQAEDGIRDLVLSRGLVDVYKRQGLGSLLNSLASLEAAFDLLLVDTGAGLGEAVISLVLSAAEIMLVTTPEPNALADAYGLLKVVARRSPGARVHAVSYTHLTMPTIYTV